MKTAIIITGLPRCVGFNVEELTRITESFDVFVVTNRTKDLEFEAFDNIKSITYIDDIAEEKAKEKQYLDMKDGFKILQWQKLKIGMSALEAYEAKNSIFYDAIFKIRTDLIFHNDFIIPKVDSSTFHMNTDLYFGGTRSNFKKISQFIDYIDDYYENYSFLPFNAELMHSSEHSAARFHWLNYPKALEGLTQDFSAFQSLDFKQYKEEFSIKSDAFSFREDYRDITFATEPSFLHYVLANGLIVRNFDFEKMGILPFRKLSDLPYLENINSDEFLTLLRTIVPNSMTAKQAKALFKVAKKCRYHNTKKAQRLLDIVVKTKPHNIRYLIFRLYLKRLL